MVGESYASKMSSLYLKLLPPHPPAAISTIILPKQSHMNKYFKTCINSLWPDDGNIDLSTLAQVMACCLAAPSHYLNQCWLISEVLRHSPRSIFIVSAQGTILYNEFEIHTFKLLPHLPEANEWRAIAPGPSDAYTHQWTGSSLVQVMIFRLFVTSTNADL